MKTIVIILVTLAIAFVFMHSEYSPWRLATKNNDTRPQSISFASPPATLTPAISEAELAKFPASFRDDLRALNVPLPEAQKRFAQALTKAKTIQVNGRIVDHLENGYLMINAKDINGSMYGRDYAVFGVPSAGERVDGTWMIFTAAVVGTYPGQDRGGRTIYELFYIGQ